MIKQIIATLDKSWDTIFPDCFLIRNPDGITIAEYPIGCLEYLSKTKTTSVTEHSNLVELFQKGCSIYLFDDCLVKPVELIGNFLVIFLPEQSLIKLAIYP